MVKEMKALIGCLFIVLLSAEVRAQDPRIAAQAFSDGNYFKAIELYVKLLGKNPDEMDYNYRVGLSYLRTSIEPRRALEYLLKAENHPKFPPEGLLAVAEAYSYHLQYDMALTYLNKYQQEGHVNKKTRAEFERLKANYTVALELLKYPADVTFRNLGPMLNSEYPDYHPFVDKNERILIFTSRRKSKPGAVPEFDGYFPSNLYMSEKNASDEWKEAVKLSDRINTSYDEQAVGLSDSGDSLFFYIDHINSFGNIYLSERIRGVYGDPKALNEAVNTENVESACSISRDGNTLIFSSDRPGGYGGLDIWMRRKLPTGKWGEPLNLGPEINTPFDEDFPTLSGDNRTLYFCSEGHPGMGKFDLFFSTWDPYDNSWGHPQNLGFPINTPGDEKSISFNGYGDRAYVTALRPEGKGDLDIYEVNYVNVSGAMPAVFLVNAPELEEAAAENNTRIRVKNEADELIGEYAPNRVTGKYVLALYPGKYTMTLKADGFQPYSEPLIVNNAHLRQEKNLKTINLKKQ